MHQPNIYSQVQKFVNACFYTAFVVTLHVCVFLVKYT
jgi:hypothetical protein